MNSTERLEQIHRQFERSVQQFCKESNGLFCETERVYKGEHLPQNLRYGFATIYYHSFSVKFIYTARGTLGVINSILGCCIRLDKTDEGPDIPLPLLSDYCDVDTVTPTFVPLITDAQAMIQAVDCVGSVVKLMQDTLTAVSGDPERRQEIYTKYTEEMKTFFKLDTMEYVDSLDVYHCFLMRFNSEAFLNFLNGNRSKAVKQLQKLKNHTGYETRLLRLWTTDEQPTVDLSCIRAKTALYNDRGVQKNDRKEFLTVFLAWLLLCPLASAVFLGVFGLFVFLEGNDSVYLLGPQYNFPFCILFGFVTSIALSYFTRFFFYKRLFKRDYDRFVEMDTIQNAASDRAMRVFLAILVVVGVFGSAFLAKWNLNFQSDGFVDNTKFLSFQGEYYTYDDIERVYYRPNRINDFGETLDFPSYVIALKNGKEIDLYEYGDMEDYADRLLPYLREQNVAVEEIAAQ